MDVRDEDGCTDTGGRLVPFPEIWACAIALKEDPLKAKSIPCCGFKESETAIKVCRPRLKKYGSMAVGAREFEDWNFTLDTKPSTKDSNPHCV